MMINRRINQVYSISDSNHSRPKRSRDNSRVSKGLEEMNILSNILTERLDLEIAGGKRDGEGAVHREEALSVKPDPQLPRQSLFRAADGGDARRRNRHRRGEGGRRSGDGRRLLGAEQERTDRGGGAWGSEERERVVVEGEEDAHKVEKDSLFSL